MKLSPVINNSYKPSFQKLVFENSEHMRPSLVTAINNNESIQDYFYTHDGTVKYEYKPIDKKTSISMLKFSTDEKACLIKGYGDDGLESDSDLLLKVKEMKDFGGYINKIHDDYIKYRRIFAEKLNTINVNIKENNFRIKGLTDWDFETLYDFVTSPVLKSVSQKQPIKARYDEDTEQNIAVINLKFGDKFYKLKGYGDDMREAQTDLRSKIMDLNERGETNFYNNMKLQMSRIQQTEALHQETNEKTRRNMEQYRFDIKGINSWGPFVLYNFVNSNAMQKISLQHSTKASYKENELLATAEISMKFGDKQYVIKGSGDDILEARNDIIWKIKSIDNEGVERFMKKAAEYTENNKKYSIFSKEYWINLLSDDHSVH